VEDFDNDGDLDIANCAYNDDALNYFENEKYVLSVANIETERFTMYPNPTTNVLHFEGFEAENIDVEIYDILGKKVLYSSIASNRPLDVSHLNVGMYVIKIDNGFISKFIKE
jgi:hypothetical protein